MRHILIGIVVIVAGITALHAADDNKKWASSKNCEACHKEIISTWRTSRHANSHFSKNNLFKKTLEYIVKQQPTRLLDEVKVDCAKCHNPKISKSDVNDKDKIMLAMGIEEKKDEYDKVLNAEIMQDGISCLICHNVKEIHLDKNKGSQGLHSIEFGPIDTMYGPFDDANSPYHKTVQRPHFVEDNPTLCFACHFSSKNQHGLEVYGTGKEYDTKAEGVEGCKKCHMSQTTPGHASNYAPEGGEPKSRMVREHRFKSVDNSRIFSTYVDVTAARKFDKFVVTIANNTPHKIPTGYGLRVVTIKATFLDANNKKIGEGSQEIGIKWRDKNGKQTVPHLAHAAYEDTRIDGKSSQNFEFPIPNGAKHVAYELSYRLINDEMAKTIKIDDPFFTKKYIVKDEKVRL